MLGNQWVITAWAAGGERGFFVIGDPHHKSMHSYSIQRETGKFRQRH